MDFVGEGKLDEERKRRQQEWERVRSKDDPIEAPPEVFDNRTLYEKLKEQHDLKKQEFEEQYALKNQIRGVDSDEVQFLNEVDRVRTEREREIRLQEKKELEEVKKAAAHTSSVAEVVPKITVNLPSNKKENKQAELLSHCIKRKSGGASTSSSMGGAASSLMKLTDSSFDKITGLSSSKSKKNGEDENDSDSNDNLPTPSKKTKANSSDAEKTVGVKPSQIVLGILPGLGEYNSDSSEASDSSEEDDEHEETLNTHSIMNRVSSDTSAAAKLTKL